MCVFNDDANAHGLFYQRRAAKATSGLSQQQAPGEMRRILVHFQRPL